MHANTKSSNAGISFCVILLLIAKAVEALGYGACAAAVELDMRGGIWHSVYSQVVNIEGDDFP